MLKEKRVCPNQTCKYSGAAQPLSNFHIKSRRKNKIYRERFCSHCKNKERKIKRKNQSKPYTDNDTNEFHGMNNENILKEYNQLTTDNITCDEFNHAIKAILILSKWSKRLKEHPRGHSRT
jgi:hypothetical protein